MTDRGAQRAAARTDPDRLVAWLRAGSLLLAAAITASVPGSSSPTWLRIGWLAVIAAAASWPLPRTRPGRGAAVLEVAGAAAVVGSGGDTSFALLPYLLAPCLAAGLRGGVVWAAVTVACAEAALVGTGLVVRPAAELGDFFVVVAEWTLITLVVGLLGAWVRRVQQGPGADVDPAYVSAHRLLSELWLVARQLPAGLDPVTLASALLSNVRDDIAYSRAAVIVRSPSGLLIPLAVDGVGDGAGEEAGRLDWGSTVPGGALLAEAWSADVPVLQQHGFAGEPGVVAAAFPLRMGARTFGLVALELHQPPEQATLRRAMALAQESALRLETALLFADVRSIATSEERRRLAREIHDGIAQDLTSFGYGIDDLVERVPERWVRAELRQLRAELSRVIGELRMSIFDLRSDVSPGSGLSASLSDYVRQVGAASSMTIHLVLDESPQRLRLDTEIEVLRIAQEAITNARRHARAANLWVTCRISPPDALLEIEDDGVGLGPGRGDSFGTHIMHERAERIGGTLTLGRGSHGGTLVQLRLGQPLDGGAVGALREARA